MERLLRSTIEVHMRLGSGLPIIGFPTAITIGADGLPIISYKDGAFLVLTVAHCSNAQCTSATVSTLPGAVGQYTSITIGADGLPIISFDDGVNRDLQVAHCSDPQCTSPTISTIDSAGDVGQ